MCVILEEEVARLPERFRNPLLLCCWEGKSRDEAAQQLGWSLGTVKARLERGRQMLRQRLARRGLTLAAGLLALSVASGAVSAALTASTVRGARIAVGAATGTLPEGIKRLLAMGTTMLGFAKWKIALAITLGLLTVGLGLGLTSYLTRPTPSPEIAAAPENPAPAPQKADPELLPPPKGEPPVPVLRVDASGDPLPQEAIRRLGTTRWRMTDTLWSVACSGDGKRLVTASREGPVVVWDTATGKPLRELAGERIWDVAISMDGEIVAASVDTDRPDVDGIFVWTEGKKDPTRFFKVSDRVSSLLLKGNRLWVGGRKGVYCWDVETGNSIVERKFTQPHRVWAMAVSPGVPALLAVGTSGGIELYDEKGKQIDASDFTIGDTTNTLAFAPDGRSVAIGSSAGNLHVWDIIGQRVKPRISIKLQGGGIAALVYSSDSNELISVDEHARCVVSNARTGRFSVASTLNSRGSAIGKAGFPSNCFVLSPNGQHCFGQLGTEDKHFSHHLCAWDVSTGQENHPSAGHETAVGKLMFQTDGSLLSLAEDGMVILWNQKGEEVQRQHFPKQLLDCAALSEDGRMTAVQNTRVGIFDLFTGKSVRWISETATTNVRAALAPDRNTLVVAGENSLAFHFLNEKMVHEMRTRLPAVSDVVFSPDGQLVALMNPVGTRIWSVPKRKELCTLGTFQCAGLLAFAPDRSQVAVWSGGNVITLAHAETGIRHWEIKVDARVVRALAFGPRPDLLTIASENGIHIVNCQTGDELVRLNGGLGGASSLAYSLDRDLLACGCLDSTVLLWDVKSILGRGIIPDERPTLVKKIVPESGLLAKDPAILWNDLGSTDVSRGLVTIRALRAGGETTLTLLHDRLLTPEKPFGNEAERRLVANLADPDYKIRATAFAELKKNPTAVEPLLRDAYRDAQDDILRLRLQTFLKELESEDLLVPHDEQLRDQRVILLLELMDSPGARKLLATLAHDAKSESLRAAASAALERRP